MTSTQRLPRTVSEKLNEDNEKHTFFEERPSIGFLSTLHSRTSYPARTDWVLYWIKLATLLPFKFQQKTNIALNNCFDPQIAIPFNASNRYEKWYLYCLVYDFL